MESWLAGTPMVMKRSGNWLPLLLVAVDMVERWVENEMGETRLRWTIFEDEMAGSGCEDC